MIRNPLCKTVVNSYYWRSLLRPGQYICFLFSLCNCCLNWDWVIYIPSVLHTSDECYSVQGQVYGLMLYVCSSDVSFSLHDYICSTRLSCRLSWGQGSFFLVSRSPELWWDIIKRNIKWNCCLKSISLGLNSHPFSGQLRTTMNNSCFYHQLLFSVF